jgi:hypothetical protein
MSAQAAQAAPVAQAAQTSLGTTGALANGFRGPIAKANIWSAILRMVISISGHASRRMVERGLSQATLKHIVNEGKVHARHGGVTYIRAVGWEVRVNSKTGNVITVVKVGGGGYSGGR